MQEQVIKLDYTIQSPEERNELVKKLIVSLPPEKLTNRYLQILADYIIFAMTKEQKKTKTINTENRMITINKRQTSYEGLTTKFENGQDGVYNLIIENDKNIILTPKISITAEDIAQVPGLKELRQAIANIEREQLSARGQRKYLLKKQLIQMRQDQYILKTSYYKPIYCLSATKNFHTLNFEDNITINEDGTLTNDGLISFFNPKHLSLLLCNYSKLKEDCYGKFNADGYYMMQDLDNLVEKTLRENYPLYYKLLIYKIDGKTNLEIQTLLNEEFNIKHSIEYISALWRNKIPKLLADQAEKDYLIWYFKNVKRGRWKQCTCCGQKKLAHNKFFSKNNSSKDGFYSICKDCRNARTKRNPVIVKRIPYVKVREPVNASNGS